MTLIFGRRAIVMTPCILDDVACMLLNQTKPQGINGPIDTKKEWVDNPDVRLEFETEEGLNQLISKLELLRDFMHGDFHNLEMIDEGDLRR